jgi:flagellar basal-body rod protein FlgC
MASIGPGYCRTMSDGMSISVSGMQAASLWLSATASNIANMNSDGTAPTGQPGLPADQGNSAYHPLSVSQTTAATGAVSASLQPSLPAFRLKYDPQAPYANMQGLIATPNVDPATQMVQLQDAANGFRANLLAFKTSSSMFKSLLDATA